MEEERWQGLNKGARPIGILVLNLILTESYFLPSLKSFNICLKYTGVDFVTKLTVFIGFYKGLR